jgi:hypothetical protein
MKTVVIKECPDIALHQNVLTFNLAPMGVKNCTGCWTSGGKHRVNVSIRI